MRVQPLDRDQRPGRHAADRRLQRPAEQQPDEPGNQGPVLAEFPGGVDQRDDDGEDRHHPGELRKHRDFAGRAAAPADEELGREGHDLVRGCRDESDVQEKRDRGFRRDVAERIAATTFLNGIGTDLG